MAVLVACEESQAVCIEFRKLGIEAYSCDTLPCTGGHPEWHLQGDAIEVLNSRKWQMIIAFPPCTYITAAGACRMYPTAGNIDPKRLEKAIKGKEFFMQFLEADCRLIAVENPKPLKVVELPKHTQVIQPYQFGHAFSKKTLLWIKGLPPLVPTEIITENIVPWVYGGKNDSNGNPRKNVGIKRTASDRSKTFTGIAKAMALQWSPFLYKPYEPVKILEQLQFEF